MKKQLIFAFSLLFSLAVNIISMRNGFFNLPQHLYYIPILLGVFMYGKTGLLLSGFTSVLYIGSVLLFSGQGELLAATLVRVGIFMSISVLVYVLLRRNQLQEQKMTAFFDINADIMCSVTRDGYFMEINKAFEIVLGYSKEDVKGKRPRDLVHPEDILAKASSRQSCRKTRPSSGSSGASAARTAPTNTSNGTPSRRAT